MRNAQARGASGGPKRGLLRDRSLASICWELHDGGASGRLLVIQGSEEREIVFTEGLPRCARSTVPAESLTSFLRKHGLASARDLGRVALGAVNDPVAAYDLLLHSEILPADESHAAIAMHTRHVLLAAFVATEGSFNFTPSPGAGTEAGVGTDLFGLLREAVATRLSPAVVARAFPEGSGIPLRRGQGLPAILRRVRLVTEERKVLNAVDGRRTSAEVVTASGLQPERALAILYLAREVGMVETVQPAAEPEHLTVVVPHYDPTPTISAEGIKSPALAQSDGIDHEAVIGALGLEGYYVRRTVGRGAWGWVYQAYQDRLDRMVAVKVLSPSLDVPDNEDRVERFVNEARSAARLNHPNVVSVYDCNQRSGVRYFVMEYVDGTTLREIVEARGPLSDGEILWVAKRVARALEHAHAKNILHRDVKPDNVFAAEGGLLKLGDWGLARDTDSLDEGLTVVGGVVGTPNYMSPEQLRGEPGLDGRADLYALGGLLHYLATGKPPYGMRPVMETIVAHLLEAPPDPRATNPKVGGAVARIIASLMAKDRAQRYRTARELIDVVDGTGIEPAEIPGPFGARSREKPQ